MMLRRETANFDRRPTGQPVDILVLHYTGMQSTEAALARMCDPAAKVSAHYMIDETGTVTGLVDEGNRAWHAGVSHWAGADDVNGRSIGIELVNPGHEFGYRPFPDRQIATLLELAGDIIKRHPIPPHRVLGHSDVAPDRKRDPGELFDWRRLAVAGVGLWPAALETETAALAPGSRGDAVTGLQRDLAGFGYGIKVDGIYGSMTRAVVAALQRHFRPRCHDGVADPETRGLLAALNQALP